MFWLCYVEATAGSLVPHRREGCRARAAGERVLHPRIASTICLGKCRPQQSEEKRPVPKTLSRQLQHQIQHRSQKTARIPQASCRENASQSIFEPLVGCLSIAGICAPMQSAKTLSDADPTSIYVQVIKRDNVARSSVARRYWRRHYRAIKDLCVSRQTVCSGLVPFRIGRGRN